MLDINTAEIINGIVLPIIIILIILYLYKDKIGNFFKKKKDPKLLLSPTPATPKKTEKIKIPLKNRKPILTTKRT